MMLGFLAISLLSVSAFCQIPTSAAPDISPETTRFQVATIKPSGPEEIRTVQIQGNRFATTQTSIVDLLKYAFGFHEQEIAGGPKWLETQKFDIVGDPETQTRPSSEDFKKMVQNLLTDRFHLTAHHESRDLPLLEIVQLKSGAKLTKSTRPPNGIPTVGYSPGRLAVGNATIADLAAFLQRFVADRPVVDQTGITGRYDLTLKWTPDESVENRQGDESNNSLPGSILPFRSNLD